MRDTEKGTDWEKEKLTNGWPQQTQNQQQFNVVRRVYQQQTLNKDAEYHVSKKTLGKRCKKVVQGCGFGDCLKNSLPIIKWLPKYSLQIYLIGDLIAGATTAVMHIPQGMAYSLLAEAPPIMGLYMAFFPILVYVLLGTSPHVSLGTFAVACLMAGKVVHEHATETDGIPAPYTPLQVLSLLCLMVGVFQLIMWMLRLGAVSTLLSEPLVSGFTTGASFQVCASQLKDLFGIKLPRLPTNFKVIFTLIEVCKNLVNTNWAAFLISFITCFVIAINNEHLKPWVSKRSRIPVPVELIAIVSGTLASRYLLLNENYNISLVGDIPTGLPVPAVPPLELFPELLVDAFTQTMVTYTVTLSMGFIFASKEKYEIDANQELLAMGSSNIFGSFFCCAPICASLSRSYIQYTAGSKTAVTSLVSASLILCVLLWIGPFFEKLPRCVLAAIVVVSLKGLFMQVKDLRKFWKLSKLDALVWIVTFLVTLLVNVDIGLGAGLLASVGTLFFRAQTPYTCLLGRVMETDLYLDIKRYRGAQELPGIKIFHYCGGLNFATKNQFRSSLYRKTGYLRPSEEPEEIEDIKQASYERDLTFSNRIQCVIVDATALSYVDAPGIKTLVAAQQELASCNISLLLAGANSPVLEMIDRFNSLESEKLKLLTFPTVHDAVVYYNATKLKKNDIPITITS
ncbi:prestin-like isoform X2 [Anticarsia gemmatalis]|uniref:prestin-like isoform X2 n=1 Tax=Anticarsia gemmatalis TaxID=129554 RepID=UPI003F75D067